MIKIGFSAILLLATFSTSCAWAIINSNIPKVHRDSEEVLQKAEELRSAVNSKNPEAIWGMLMPGLHKVSRDSYIKYYSDTYSTHEIYVDQPSLIRRNHDIAETKANYTYRDFGKDGQLIQTTVCEKAVWAKRDKKWYLHTIGLDCNYELGGVR